MTGIIPFRRFVHPTTIAATVAAASAIVTAEDDGNSPKNNQGEKTREQATLFHIGVSGKIRYS